MDCALTPSDACVISGSEDGESQICHGRICLTSSQKPCSWVPIAAVYDHRSPGNPVIISFTQSTLSPVPVFPHLLQRIHSTLVQSTRLCKPLECIQLAAGRVCYWDLVEEKMLESFQAHGSYVCSLAMHPDGSLLLTSSTDGTVKVWQ